MAAEEGGFRIDKGAVVKGPVAGAALDFLEFAVAAESVGFAPSARFEDLDFFFPFPFDPSVFIFTFRKRTM